MNNIDGETYGIICDLIKTGDTVAFSLTEQLPATFNGIEIHESLRTIKQVVISKDDKTNEIILAKYNQIKRDKYESHDLTPLYIEHEVISLKKANNIVKNLLKKEYKWTAKNFNDFE